MVSWKPKQRVLWRIESAVSDAAESLSIVGTELQQLDFKTKKLLVTLVGTVSFELEAQARFQKIEKWRK